MKFSCADRFSIFFFSRHPNTSIVTQRLRHQGELTLILTTYWNTGWVNLSETRIGHECPLAVCFPCCGHIRSHRICREEEYVSVSTRTQQHCVCSVTLELTCYQVFSDDTTSLAVHHNQFLHLVTSVHFHTAFSDLTVQCRIRP
ncbi:MAG: Uncharacterised protein [Cryomorphaceae bacterium]|nr:MAG: Uncharacterised protein [Cryomorphaceae bacterium]